MKKLLLVLPPVVALAIAVILLTRAPDSSSDPTPASAQTAKEPAGSSSTPPALPADSTSSAVAAPAPSAPPSLAPKAAATTTLRVGPIPAGLTNTPKTLNELHRAYDAINAAIDSDTQESISTLIGFAITENDDVRGAALNGLINRDAVAAAPLLRKAAKELDDSKAIIAILQTADYLELPPVTMSELSLKRQKVSVDTLADPAAPLRRKHTTPPAP